MALNGLWLIFPQNSKTCILYGYFLEHLSKAILKSIDSVTLISNIVIEYDAYYLEPWKIGILK